MARNARSAAWRPLFALTLAIVATGSIGCSLRSLAVRTVAAALAEGGSVFASDDDPELVGDALPFALKTFEALLESAPDDRDLLLATCSGFTQYAYGFVAVDAERLEFLDYVESQRVAERAVALYLRARDYCLRGLAAGHPGIGDRLVAQPVAAAAELGSDEIDLVYWTAASWGSAIAGGIHRPEVVADLPVVRALFDRALELEPDYSDGALHEALIRFEALPEAMGGSREKAEAHYRRAVALSGDTSAAPHLAWATSVLVPAQEADAFRQALQAALAVDPDAAEHRRLANRIAQERARHLLAHVEDLFLDVGDP